MNYAGKFGSIVSDPHSSGHFDFSPIPQHGHAGTVTIPDAHLLFSGDYARSGVDLIVSDHDHRVVVPDYFHGEKRPMLVSPEGAPLDPKVIEALTGHVEYAQAAGAAAAAKVIGHVIKMTGSASIVRNGVTIELNTGDNVYQSDVVQTGSGSTLGLVLNDGTTFNMTANARLMLNDLTFDASSTSNTALFTLVQGAASFVAGQVAKTGDMKVATPVATMGIRGTAVILDVSATDGHVSISVVDQHDGLLHSVAVYNAQGIQIGTVTSSGAGLTLTPTANFDVIAQESNKTPAQVALEFNAFETLLNIYNAAKLQFPDLPQHTENINPQTNTKYGGSPPADSPSTKFPAPDPGLHTGQNLNGPPPTIVNLSTDLPPVFGPPALPAAPPIIQIAQIQVPTVSLPFVVTPSTVTKISTGPSDHVGPAMSADGQFITYDPDGSIFLYERASNTTITIASAGGGIAYSSPTISSDGHFIVYQGSDGTHSYVYLYNNNPSDPAHFGQTTQLMAGGAPAISGDGSIIVAESNGGGIGVYDQQGHTIATITPAAFGGSGALWMPAVSADGHVIAFWNTNAATPGGPGELYTYDLTTGKFTAIAPTSNGAGTSAASFSADGHFVVYQSDAADGHPEIFLYDLTTGHVVFHTENAAASYHPVISPDGHFIIFTSDAQLTAADTDSVTDAYVVDVTNPAAPVYQLVSENGNALSNGGVAISAFGQYEAFASNASFSTANGSNSNIFVDDPTSGRGAIIAENAHSPSILTADGVIALTGNESGITLSVSDQSGHPTSLLTAAFDAQGNIHWSFSEPKSDFASLQPGQGVVQNFVITLSTSSSTTTISVQVSVYDSDHPVITVTHAPPVIDGANNVVSYTASGPAVAVDSGIVVADVDSTTLAGATATISSGFQAGDALTINGSTDGDLANGGGTIHYHFDSTTHAISLSGTDTLADYQVALSQVSFCSRAAIPPPAARTTAAPSPGGSTTARPPAPPPPRRSKSSIRCRCSTALR